MEDNKLDVGDEFFIKYEDGHISSLKYRFFTIGSIKNRVFLAATNTKRINNEMLVSLLWGSGEVIKIPWKPKRGDWYCFIKEDGNRTGRNWYDTFIDYMLYNAGNCFRDTEEVTLEIKERILREMKGKCENN